VEAARIAVLYHDYWKQEYARLEKRLGSNKAIVVIARKLLVVVWHVLTDRTADRHASPQKVADKFLLWSRFLGDEKRGGLTSRQFIRLQLMRLKACPERSRRMGDDVTHVRHGINARPLATRDEILALHPELKTDD
jgi:hypothetical protein